MAEAFKSAGTSPPECLPELPSWPDLFADPTLFAILPAKVQADIYGRVAGLEASLRAQLLAGRADGDGQLVATEADRVLDIDEAARRLNTSKDSLYRRWRRLPFAYKDAIDGKLKFSARGLARYIEDRRKRAY